MFNLIFLFMSKPQTSLPQHTAHLSRSGFDMSQSFAFTAAPGMILPVYSDMLNAGEKVRISSDLFARTQPLVTAAMADVDIYLDWFFVPATMIFTAWQNVRYMTNDLLSSLYDDLTNPTDGIFAGKFPTMNMRSMAVSDNISKDAYYGSPTVSGTTAKTLPTALFDSYGKSMFRMLDMLHYNPLGIYSENPDGWNPNVFPWRALVYQAIYQDYYRNDDWERRNVYAFNWDRYFNAAIPINFNYDGLSSLTPNNPFILRYRNYRKDYFTSSKPSPIMSAVNALGGSGVDVGVVLSNIDNYLSSSSVSVFDADGSAGYLNSSDSFENFGSLSNNQASQSGSLIKNNVLGSGSLRSLFAVDKLLRITGRSRKDYDSQVLAHFGFHVPHDVKHELTKLTSYHAMLHIGEVVGTADTFNGTTGSALGEIAGKGYISINNTKPCNFTAPVDGFIMCCFSAVPRFRVSGGVDKQNALTTRLDLYTPEFDKLGMQPIFVYEAQKNFLSTGSAASIFGWQRRYAQYKEKYDRASFVFSTLANENNVNQYSAWILSINYGNIPFTTPSNLPINDLIDGGVWLKVSPKSLNSIMAIPYTTTMAADNGANAATNFYTDPFICDFRANVKKVSTMSPSGEPDLE